MKETERDIYYNSCIHWNKTKYYNNEEINIYLIDKRFIIDLNRTIDFLLNIGCNLSNYQDDFYLIIETNKYFNKEKLFIKLLEEELIMSLYDFVLIYKPIMKY